MIITKRREPFHSAYAKFLRRLHMKWFKYDLLIKNGHVYDPAAGIDEVRDVLVRRSRIVEKPADFDEKEVLEVFDASGYLVTPGLIDYHTHTGFRRSDFAIDPDLYGLPNGITTIVAAGSCGSGDFETMAEAIIPRAQVTMKANLHITATGMVTEMLPETQTSEYWDVLRDEYIVERYRDVIAGLKIRFGNNNPKMDFGPLPEAIKLAERLGLPLIVHIARTLVPYDDAVDQLRKNDVHVHIFQKSEYNMFEPDGKNIRKCILDARDRGVLFDASVGRTNHSFEIMRKAIDKGFYPDIISTDVVAYSAYRTSNHSVLRAMSAFKAVGMPMDEVMRAVTKTPAEHIGLYGEVGTIRPGALADIAIFKENREKHVLTDWFKEELETDLMLEPQMTVKAGRIVYMSVDYAFKHQESNLY